MTRFETIVKDQLEKENPDCFVHKYTDLDFYVIEKSSGKIRKLVEAKAVGDSVRANQQRIHDALRKSGIEVEVRYEWGSSYFTRGA